MVAFGTVRKKLEQQGARGDTLAELDGVVFELRTAADKPPEVVVKRELVPDKNLADSHLASEVSRLRAEIAATGQALESAQEEVVRLQQAVRVIQEFDNQKSTLVYATVECQRCGLRFTIHKPYAEIAGTCRIHCPECGKERNPKHYLGWQKSPDEESAGKWVGASGDAEFEAGVSYFMERIDRGEAIEPPIMANSENGGCGIVDGWKRIEAIRRVAVRDGVEMGDISLTSILIDAANDDALAGLRSDLNDRTTGLPPQ